MSKYEPTILDIAKNIDQIVTDIDVFKLRDFYRALINQIALDLKALDHRLSLLEPQPKSPDTPKFMFDFTAPGGEHLGRVNATDAIEAVKIAVAKGLVQEGAQWTCQKETK